MITNLVLRWALTVLFALCIALYAREALATRAWQQKLAWSLHVLMAAAMIAMGWPAGMSVPTPVYVLVFTAAALYFVYLGLFGPPVAHALYHSVMMAAMVAMAVVMPYAAMPAMPSAAAMGSGHDMAMAGAGVSRAFASAASPVWVTVLCGLAAAGFVGAALWSLVVLIRGPHRPFANLLMSLGMGVAFAAMAI